MFFVKSIADILYHYPLTDVVTIVAISNIICERTTFFIFLMLVFREKNITLRLYKIYSRIMAKINRLKVVLVEKENSGKWLADQLSKSTCTINKWCSNTTQPDL